MNHIYRSIWSPITGTCVATSEHVTGPGSSLSSTSAVGAVPQADIQQRSPVAIEAWRPLAMALMLAWGGLALATPTGGVVSAGSAVVGESPGHMTITQTAPHVAINWQSFGIGVGQSVQFVQPGRASVALNRVLGGDASSILGSLASNGQVFLINPNGILFGAGASVNVGGLVASTLKLGDADFMAGRYRFMGEGAGPGTVVNQGVLRAADGGYVALLGTQVDNQGTVQATRGSVAMAAGQAMTLDLLGEQLLSVRVDQGAANALLGNGGLLQADGGQVLMSTQAAGNWLANAVNNTGVVQAQTVENRQGTIVLLGSMDSGTVSLGGTLDVRASAGQQAGRVLATGHQVGLFDAHILASGGAGGGQVLIGGGYQGRDPAVPHAQAVYMSPGASIEANAREQGHGGQVVLWADGSTRALGQVSARGGAQGGNGGLIETSGQWLDVGGLRVDTRAPLGQIGTWLLDPADITISGAVTTDATATGGVFAPNSGGSAANINVADLVTALGGSNVAVSTENTGLSGAGLGDIDVNAAVTWTAPTTLTLNAARDVNVNQVITGTDGSLALNAGRNVTVGAAVTTTTGQLSFTAAQDVNINAATTITTGDLQAVAGRKVTVSAASSVTTGRMVLRADNDGTGPGAAEGTVDITCGSNCLTVTTGTLSIRFNPVNYASTNSEILAYANKLTGGGTLDAKAWVFGMGDNKVYDGITTATVSGLMPDMTDASPPVSLGPVSVANFDTRDVGPGKPIIYSSTFSDGTYDLFATAQAPAGTYQTSADITPRSLLVSAVTDARIYNGTTSSVGLPTVTGLQTGDTLDGALTQSFVSKHVLGEGASTLVANGSYSISDGNGGNNYSVSVLTAPGTISPALLTITAQDVDKVYGQTPVLSGFDASALVNGETVGSVTLTSAGQVATASVAGSPYAIVPSHATGGTFTPGNYSISYVNGVLAVTPALLTITAQDVDKVYGQTPVLSGFDASALVNGETVGSVTLTSAGQVATASVAGNPYAIVPSHATGGTFAPGNYSISYVNGVLTVTPAPLTITAQDVDKVYGQTPVLSGFDASALVNGETVGSVTLTSAGQVATASVAGSPYAIVASHATGGTFTPGNYSISYVNGVLTVTPASVVPPPVVPEEPPVVPPPVVVPEEPPVVVPEEPPVVVPEEPPVVVPEEPPVVPPPVVVPEQPAVEPSPVASGEDVPSGFSEKKALPTTPQRDAQPVLLTVAPPLPLLQGPVTQAVTSAPLPVPVQKAEPVPMMAKPMALESPAVQEALKLQLPVPVPRVRRPKPDRN